MGGKRALKVVKCGLKLPLALLWALGWTGWPPEPPPKTVFSLSPCWLLTRLKITAPIENSLQVQNNLNHSFFIVSSCEMPHVRETRLASASYWKYSLYAFGVSPLPSSSRTLTQACKQNPPSHPLEISETHIWKAKGGAAEAVPGLNFLLLWMGNNSFKGKRKKPNPTSQIG